MIQINLLPWREELKKTHKKYFMLAMACAGLLALSILVFFHWDFSNKIIFQQTRNDLLQQEIARVNAKLAQFKESVEKRKKLEEQLQLLTMLLNDRFQAVRLLDELVRIVPREVYLTKIEYNNRITRLTGEADNNAQISQLMKNVKESAWFSQPNLIEIATTEKDKQHKKNFQLVIHFE